MPVSGTEGTGTWTPGYKPPTINGTTYKAPTTTFDSKGNIVSTPADGMSALTGQTTTGKSKTEFDGETFLKLLVAQLKYQDPSKPADSSQIMQQTATLSMVEKTNTMASAIDKLQTAYASMLAEARISSAVSLVGRTVSYADAKTGTITEGVVDSVKFDATGPILQVGDKGVSYQDVTAVKAPGSTSTTGTTSATGTTSTPAIPATDATKPTA